MGEIGSRALPLSPSPTRGPRTRVRARARAGVEDQTRGALRAGAAPPRLHF